MTISELQIDAANTPVGSLAPTDATDACIEAACRQACKTIAPAWPLNRAIAVNPYWSHVGMPVRRVAARMAVLGGIQVFPPRERQRLAWSEGRIGPDDLAIALTRIPEAAGLTPAECLAALHTEPSLLQLPLLIDLLDQDPQRHVRLSWREAITHQVSQTCAAYFDENQADWQPERKENLYGFWRDTLRHDHGISVLMGLPGLSKVLVALPETSAQAERWVLQRLGLAPEAWADYLEAVLLTVHGWASYCAYLDWEARLENRQDSHLRELLAIRLAWGVILLECAGHSAAASSFDALQRAWSSAPARLREAEQSLLVDAVWQAALEAAYQRRLAVQLQNAACISPPESPCEVQAAFCIDVRSEPMRRALEAVWPAVRTIGFAGFFGIPAAYTPLGSNARRPQLPALLAPRINIADSIAGPSDPASQEDETLAVQARRAHLARAAQWRAASRWPGASFSFVEAAGLGYLTKLGQWLRPGRRVRARDDLAGLPSRYRRLCRPRVVGLALEDKATLAAGVLHAMGLDRDFAPLVLLVGHGSQTCNNAHAAALDCGACCGQTGEVNARSLASLLNETEVRTHLRQRGIDIPDTSSFVAALHNTTTDEIEGFDLDLLPEASVARWQRLQAVFAQAGDQVRRERALSLGLDPRAPHDALLSSYQQRANDGAETRPEWGLANNAAFVIAPRERTRGLDLGGRVFLHDYDTKQDGDDSVLELLMTAPMLVTHWINWQYHASTCDPQRMGSGNKLLHNVVGGQLGVFEGNGGDLRIGLARQSLHDGTRWIHEALRLTVVIDAPADAIERIVGKHAIVRQLVENGWLHLWRFDGAVLQRFDRGIWLADAAGLA